MSKTVDFSEPAVQSYLKHVAQTMLEHFGKEIKITLLVRNSVQDTPAVEASQVGLITNDHLGLLAAFFEHVAKERHEGATISVLNGSAKPEVLKQYADAMEQALSHNQMDS